MAKQIYNQKHILKIHTKRLKKANWNLHITLSEARQNKEVISLSSSQNLRFIDELTNNEDREYKIKRKKREIKEYLKKDDVEKKIVKKLYKELNELKFIQDYVCIVVDSMSDFDKCNRKAGFYINNVKFKRLLGTTGGIKNSTIVYVSENVYNELHRRGDNDRNLNIPIVPAKLEAYKALNCTNSTPVTHPSGVLVVHDCVTKFKDNIISISEGLGAEPNVEEIDDFDVELIDSDGYGLIDPQLSEKWGQDLHIDYISSGFCVRNSFCKGMLYTFDFKQFANEIAKNNIVTDAWGNKHDIRNIEIILTTSMLKLWDSYDSIEHYLDCCKKNKFTFSVAKPCPETLENERTLNYQFIQSFKLNDNDIEELIQPTINEINGSLGMDYAKTLLFLRGRRLDDNNAFLGDNDYTKALMISDKLLQDPFIQQKIINMRRKRINDAKVGVLNVRGNYAVISGDPYSLCQSVFGLEITGLLKANECYADYWNNVFDKEGKENRYILAFRAPMSCHNNIRKLKVKNDSNMKKWYKYMKTCVILSSWDSVTHAENGADKDGDAFVTTDNEVLLRRFVEERPIFCEQKSATKIVPTEKDLIQSNKDGFGDAIGTTTNRISEMYDVISLFDENSIEYNVLKKRIMCGQHYQQCAIDKIKGIKSSPMPKTWYDMTANKPKTDENGEILDTASELQEKEFNMKILANKKPYFFIYIYPQLKNKYNTFKKEASNKAIIQFGRTLDDLLSDNNLTDGERDFVHYYNLKNPVSEYPSTMNKICSRIEKEFENIKDKLNLGDFDSSILKSDTEYSNRQFKKIKKMYDEYNDNIKQFKASNDSSRIHKEDRQNGLNVLRDEFIEKCNGEMPNKDCLCNMIIDICYAKNKSKQFAWDIVGDQIIENLLSKNDGIISYPVKDDEGKIQFLGDKFILKTVKLGGV